MVNPQGIAPQVVPRFKDWPSTIFNARRKNIGGFSRACRASIYMTPGQLFAPMSANNWPGVMYMDARQARENPPIFFRRALKIVDGQSLNLGTTCGAIPCGLTIASENPVYIQGDYNAPANGTWAGPSVAAAVAADAITLLSDNWNDVNSFAYPYSIGTAGTRTAVQTAYRTALIAGKSIPFVNPAGEAADFG